MSLSQIKSVQNRPYYFKNKHLKKFFLYFKATTSDEQYGECIICRRDFTDKKRSLKASETNSHPSHEPQRKRLRSSIEACDLKSQCFFCGKKSPTDKKNAKRNPIHMVTFVEFHKNILEKCRRRNDTWGCEVYVRLSCSNDLIADEGRYHKTCLQRFMMDKKSPNLTLCAFKI